MYNRKFSNDDRIDDATWQRGSTQRCSAVGCCMPGGLSHDTRGGNKTYYCRWHFYATPDQYADITARLKKARSRILKPLETPRGINKYHQTDRDGRLDHWIVSGEDSAVFSDDAGPVSGAADRAAA